MPTGSKGSTGKDSTMAKDKCPRLHIDYAGLPNRSYYLIIVDSFTKWPEIVKCRHLTATNTIKALNEIFSCFGFPKTLVSGNGTQFMEREFKEFCTSLSIDPVKMAVNGPRSNGPEEKFVDTFKRALRKNQGVDTNERSIHKFLALFRITLNPNMSSGLLPAELMFVRKMRTVFDRLLPSPAKKTAKIENQMTKAYKPGDKVFSGTLGLEKCIRKRERLTKELDRSYMMKKVKNFSSKDNRINWDPDTKEVTENT